MHVEWIEPGPVLELVPESTVVCIPVYGAHELFVACLQSVLAHTDSGVPILVCDDVSPDDRSIAFVRELAAGDGPSSHRLLYLRQPRNVGFPANVNTAFAAAAPADVVILNSDCLVGEGWLEGLMDAARSDSTVATATTLTNHGTIVSVPGRSRPGPLPADWTVERAAAAVRAGSLRIHPRLPTAIGHCFLVRRAALDLVGGFDESFSPGYGEEVDFSQRCLQSGLCHVLADDVFVFHHGSGSFRARDGRSSPQERHERRLRGRYPYYADTVREVEDDVTGPLARALGAARRSLTGVSVLIDARILAGTMTGTQLHVLELIAALSRTGRVELTALVPERLPSYAATVLERLPNVTCVTRDALEAPSGEAERTSLEFRADVVHRPFQIDNHDDLSLLTRFGDRLVVTNQDLIGYHNPAYFRSFEDWQGYRTTTRLALSAADGVVFFSEHARRQALEEDLLEPSRATVVHIGVDHTLRAACPVPAPPRGHDEIPPEAEVLLCIGTDFRHKNRVFALRVADQLRERHGFTGRLLLAGPSVATGSSRPQEAELLLERPELHDVIVELGAVSEAEKAWLYTRAGLVLYPTVHEGFGLVPFEAAEAGVPCAWAPGTSLSEVLPDAEAAIHPWDAARTADRAVELLRDPDVRTRNLAAVRAAAEPWRWERTAERLLEVYRTVCEQPATPGSRMARREGMILGNLSQDAMRLVGPGGAIPQDVERPLLALAMHRAAAIPVFGALRLGYRAGYGWRRRRVTDGDGPPSRT